MKWFTGSIGEAISFAQSQKHTFVAYVGGTCDKSKSMSSIFNDGEVSAGLEKSTFVCVKLEANSIGHKQLVEIYKTIPVPSLFFISHFGVPLDVVDGNLYNDNSELRTSIIIATEYSGRMNSEQESPQIVSGDKLLEERRKQVEEILSTKTKQAAEKRKVKPETEGGSEEKPEPEDMKKMMIDAELKKMTEEREKDKREEATARQRILDQIALDKAERAEKMKAAYNESKASTSSVKKTETPKPKPPPSTDARIQFKLPTGESKSSTFPNSTTLLGIRSYIDENLGLPSRDYRLTTMFPRQEFTSENNESTLEELNLTPTAVILILIKSSGSVNPLAGNWFKVVTDMLSDFLHPLYSLSNYLRGLLFRTNTGGRATQPPTQSPPSASQQRQAQPSRTSVRKAGNIHGLRDLRDGNDENNTWNGNSTQQM